ncbi:MAG: hypothetical protein LBR39_03865 [Coriobacteriales bacterium]|nr:hypothetical protein [Coriobacteriales bacterium]
MQAEIEKYHVFLSGEFIAADGGLRQDCFLSAAFAADNVSRCQLAGYTQEYTGSGRSFLVPLAALEEDGLGENPELPEAAGAAGADGAAGVAGAAGADGSPAVLHGFVVSLTAEQLWTLDQWKQIPFLYRETLPAGDVLSCDRGSDGEFHCYVLNTCIDIDENPPALDMAAEFALFDTLRAENKLGMCDIHIMLPCSFDNYDEGLMRDKGFLVNSFVDHIDQSRNHEFARGYMQDAIERYPIGTYMLHINISQVADKPAAATERYTLPAFMFYTRNTEARVGMVSVVMPNVSISALHVLNAFKYNESNQNDIIRIGVRGISGQANSFEEFDEFLLGHGFETYSPARALVFAFNEVDEQTRLECLAVEAEPLGRIMSEQLHAYATENIAPYDAADMYCSEDCLLEVWKDNYLDPQLSENPDDIETSLSFAKSHNRLHIESSEVFLLELIMFQVAAISRISARMDAYLESTTNEKTEQNKQLLIDLSFQMHDVISFIDFNKFLFPTVRLSAEKISDRFGVNQEIEKYERYKQVLEQLIALAEEQRSNVENANMNMLLLIVALVQVLPILVDLLAIIVTHQVTPEMPFSWAASILTLVIIFIIFNIKTSQKLRAMGLAQSNNKRQTQRNK